MTVRERYTQTLDFSRPDRPYFHGAYGLMAAVIDRWHGEVQPRKNKDRRPSVIQRADRGNSA